MKVLWFEISVPGRYKSDKTPEGGWQDSLEQIVRTCKDIELVIAFKGKKGMLPKEVEGVNYIPLIPKFTFIDRKIKNPADRWNSANKIIPLAVKCVENVKPDIIQVFGSEWEFGQVARYTDIPVVLHMQGCIAPYIDAIYPPGYSISDRILQAGFNIRKQIHYWKTRKLNDTWKDMERNNFQAVNNYMGRTNWDCQLVELFHPHANYFHVEEALRLSFIDDTEKWSPKVKRHKLKLVSTGCSTYWKGMDTMLRTAHVLKEKGVEFEWNIAGNMSLQKEIERKEGMKFVDNNINILGFTNPDHLKKLLLDSDIYVHTAYIDNSPNSICEAQYLGLPIISTNVGGIPSLVDDNQGGILVPANSCYNMAYEIISLSRDFARQRLYSENNILKAEHRHNPQNIMEQLLNCYNTILDK